MFSISQNQVIVKDIVNKSSVNFFITKVAKNSISAVWWRAPQKKHVTWVQSLKSIIIFMGQVDTSEITEIMETMEIKEKCS